MDYIFTHKGNTIECLQTFGRELDIFVNGKHTLTEWLLVPTKQSILFEEKILKLLKL